MVLPTSDPGYVGVVGLGPWFVFNVHCANKKQPALDLSSGGRFHD
jgi:hypothetical protein